MKKLIPFILCLFCTSILFAQLTTRHLTWDGMEREYLEYLPANYSPDNPAPVVFSLHGLGDNMNNFLTDELKLMADTANFIVIAPQALVATYMGNPIGTAWNSGASMYGVTPNENVDDTGFLMAILDSLTNHYNLDTESVFFFGFSMGGYMCNRLADEVGDRINAIASASGTMGASYTPNPENQTHVAVLHIHGTADETVPYTNNTSGIDAEDLVDFWRNHNHCSENFIPYNYPDTQQDNLTFERYVYPNGEEQVAFIKVIGGKHLWYSYPNNDINYASEIWQFFRYRFPENATIKESTNDVKWEIYPNPVNDYLNITLPNETHAKISISNPFGTKLYEKNISGNNKILMTKFPAGMYFIHLENQKVRQTYSIVKQ